MIQQVKAIKDFSCFFLAVDHAVLLVRDIKSQNKKASQSETFVYLYQRFDNLQVVVSRCIIPFFIAKR